MGLTHPNAKHQFLLFTKSVKTVACHELSFSLTTHIHVYIYTI